MAVLRWTPTAKVVTADLGALQAPPSKGTDPPPADEQGSGEEPAVPGRLTTIPGRPGLVLLLGATALLVAGGAVAIWMNSEWNVPPPAQIEGVGALIVLYVVAQAIERLMEPFVSFVVPAKPKVERDQKATDAANDPTSAELQREAANAQARVERQQT
ncbi:hypothetical protein B7486_72860, partial [cyanobacterium TDX16]